MVLCHSHDEAQQVKERLARWLRPRGLAFNEDKTRIAHLDEGCDFLGFTVRRYHGMLLIKPSKASVRRIRARLTAEVLALRGQNAAAVVAKLNPIIRGWAAYFRGVVSSEVFTSLDDHVWRLVYKWARHTHPNKPNGWVTSRYFGRFNESRQDRWVFGDRESGRYLTKFAWTRIVRHQLVIKGASVDDPALTEYWALRRRRNKPPLSPLLLRLLQGQHGRCPLCGSFLLHADRQPQSPQEWEQWLRAIRMAVRANALTAEPDGSQSDDPVAFRLTHVHCHRWRGGSEPRRPAILAAGGPAGPA